MQVGKQILSFSIFVAVAGIMTGWGASNAKPDSLTLDTLVLIRPTPIGDGAIDAYVAKALDIYVESESISVDINFYQVTVTPGTNQYKITNGKGQDVSKANALVQFGQLLLRAMKQKDNVQAVIALQTPANADVKGASMFAKIKIAKPMAVAGKAYAFTVKETAKQIALINQQITEIKEINDN